MARKWRVLFSGVQSALGKVLGVRSPEVKVSRAEFRVRGLGWRKLRSAIHSFLKGWQSHHVPTPLTLRTRHCRVPKAIAGILSSRTSLPTRHSPLATPLSSLTTRHFALLFLLPLILILWGQSGDRGLAQTPTATNPIAQVQTPQGQTAQVGADDLLQRGRTAFVAGEFADAANLWQQAATAFAAQSQPIKQAMALSNLALARQELGQITEAEQAIATSLSLLGVSANQTTVPNLTGEPLRVLAQALNTRGSLLFSQGKPDPALTAWQQAYRAYRGSGDQLGAIRNLINQAQAMRSLGLARRALDTLNQVTQLLKAEPDSLEKAVALRNLGTTLGGVGEGEQSQQALEQALAIARQRNDGNEQAVILFNLGNTLRSMQRLDQALAFYQQAASLTTNPLVQIQAQLNQLSLRLELQQPSEALRLVPTIQAQLETLPPSHTAIFARINLAQTLVKLDLLKLDHSGGNSRSRPQVLTPAKLLAEAVRQSKALGDRRSESYALGYLGNLYEQTRQWSEAQRLTEEALLLAQSINALDIAYQWQWQLGRLQKAQDNYSQAITNYDEAVNSLQALRADLVSISTDVQFSFREGIEPVYRQLVGLLLQDPPPNAPPALRSPAQRQQNLTRARDVIESLQLAELENFFQESCLQGEPIKVDTIDPTAAVFYPIILSDRLEVILSLPGQPLKHYATAIRDTEVNRIGMQLQQSFSPVASTRLRLRLAKQVYDWLIAPAAADLAASKVETLVFALDGILRNVPMAALYDGQNYLVESYNIALTPGLRLLGPRPLVKQNLKILIGALTEARQGFSALPAVGPEITNIQREVPADVLLNAQLTEQNLSDRLTALPFPLIHLATHGQFSSSADNTFILTWDGRINVKELNTILRSRSLSNLQQLELLVLSACQTASGDTRAALGLAGVAVRSGARSTVASLWPVNDEAASTTMANFYRELIKPGVKKAEALRRAQLVLLSDRSFSSPYYWAPFVVVGNWL